MVCVSHETRQELTSAISCSSFQGASALAAAREGRAGLGVLGTPGGAVIPLLRAAGREALLLAESAAIAASGKGAACKDANNGLGQG